MGSLAIAFDQHTRNAHGFPVTVEVFGPNDQHVTERTFLDVTLNVPVDEPGVYLVRAELPSGELLDASVRLDDSGDNAGVVLESEDRSPSEQLSWAYAGHGIGSLPSGAIVPSETDDHAYVDETSQGDTAARQLLRSRSGGHLDNIGVDLHGVFSVTRDFIYQALRFQSARLASSSTDQHFNNYLWQVILSATRSASVAVSLARKDAEFRQRIHDARLITSFSVEGAPPRHTFYPENTPGGEEYMEYAEPMSACAFFSTNIEDGNYRQYCYAILPRTHEVSVLLVRTDLNNIDSSDHADMGLPIARPLIRAGLPEAQALLSFLMQGSIRSARSAAELLVTDANHLLQRKVEDQLGAAIAGYFLLQAGRIDHPDWLRNLANWFPGLPDGAVIYGTYCLRQGRPEEARDYLVQAVRRGIPIYTIGLRLLFDGLRRLSNREGTDAELQEALNLVRTVAAYADWESHTSSFYLGGYSLR